jgi:MoaA/NifB/PqqE/SkfB family radical SAM enzyme
LKKRNHIEGLHPETASRPLQVNPYLHVEPERVYDPLRDRSLLPSDRGYSELKQLYQRPEAIAELPASQVEHLHREGWLIDEVLDLSSSYYLKYVSLEAHTVCNQGCSFCPVSSHRREAYFMPTEFYEEIVLQLAEHRATIDGVSIVHYNEPTVDRRFIDQISLLKAHGLPPAVVTNGTGMTAKRVDAIMELGGLRYLSVNFSTMDTERYRAERGVNHADLVVKNLDYMKDLELAPSMDIAVLGMGDSTHRRDFEAISKRYEGSRFSVKFFEIMDRAGSVPFGLRPEESNKRLCGCEQTGSRPLQWVHITPSGKCVLCCQDYHDRWVVGDLNEQNLHEILSGEPMARYRRWLHSVEEAPDDFICRHCIYARTR